MQKLLSGSRDARLVAVRRVTQLNQGKYTAGIDGKICVNSKDKEDLVEEIRGVNWNTYKCAPVRRVYIPKPGKEELRPLGIPTIKDRVLQMIVKLALEPEFEAKFEQNSYGFRPGRRCMDAINQIWKSVRELVGKQTSGWILDADIKKCFDTINHEALLNKIPAFKEIIRRWLKAGAIELGKYYKTKAGTPQGGIISPLLANVALDGLERLFGAYPSTGRYIGPSHRRGVNKGIVLVRYADDFVVIAPSRETLTTHVIPQLRTFLGTLGLRLNDAKTRIVHRNEGFDFLGFHVQQFPTNNNPFCVMKPSRESVLRHLKDIKDTFDGYKQVAQRDIIDKLNPKLRGWAQYYKYSHAKKSFAYIDFRVWQMLWQWCKRRHNGENKSTKWIKDKYFKKSGNRNWVFADKPDHVLYHVPSLKIQRYTKVKGDASPFDASLKTYWEHRHRSPMQLP